MIPSEPTTRRRFLRYLPAAALVAFAAPLRLKAVAGWPRTSPHEHPEPRPDVDASKVLQAEELQNPAAAEVYDMVREIPHIADGIRCYCGCADIPEYYSLLTCYEEGAMAQFCEICQAQARVVHQGWSKEQSLDEIRATVDARWG